MLRPTPANNPRIPVTTQQIQGEALRFQIIADPYIYRCNASPLPKMIDRPTPTNNPPHTNCHATYLVGEVGEALQFQIYRQPKHLLL